MNLWQDTRGSVIGYLTLSFPILIGISALGSEGAMWLYQHRFVQSAADTAAYSAAAAYAVDKNSDLTLQARGLIGRDYQLINGQDGVTVAVNHPPTGECYSGTSHYTGGNAVEVIVTKSVTRMFSVLWLGTGSTPICGRAVAMLPGSGDCILSLGTDGSGISNTKNNLNLTLDGCSIFSNSTGDTAISITGNNAQVTADAVGAVGDINIAGNSKTFVHNPVPGAPPITDPYATDAASWPQSGGPASTNCSPKKGSTTFPCLTSFQPGTYANGIDLSANNTTYTFAAGVYYLSGDFKMSGNSITVNATAGVTFVLLGNSVVNVTSQNSTLNLTAPAAGVFAGIAIWEPTSNKANTLSGNSFIANIRGVIYAPSASITYEANTTAGTSSCTQIVAKSVVFGGNSISLKGNCGLAGMKTFGQIAALVE